MDELETARLADRRNDRAYMAQRIAREGRLGAAWFPRHKMFVDGFLYGPTSPLPWHLLDRVAVLDRTIVSLEDLEREEAVDAELELANPAAADVDPMIVEQAADARAFARRHLDEARVAHVGRVAGPQPSLRVRPVRRITAGRRAATRSRRRRSVAAHGSPGRPGRSSDDDPHEPPLARLAASLGRLVSLLRGWVRPWR